jgi:hypothetical protein
MLLHVVALQSAAHVGLIPGSQYSP